LAINAALIIILMIISLIGRFDYQNKKIIVSGMNFQYETSKTQIIALQTKVIESGQEEKLLMEYQTFLYNLLQKNADNGSGHFYKILDSLGAQINSGVWLNQIEIEDFAKEIDLTGFALQPQNAMTYVSALNTQPSFKDNFMKLENIRNISQKNYLFIRVVSQKNTKSDKIKG
jgi:hypothetical protein